MEALFLYGVNCTESVWEGFIPLLPSWNCEIISYPHDVTKSTLCLTDLTKWVYSRVKNKKYDVIVGHSLGGLIALELTSSYSLLCDKIICLDTNLRPAGSFFRNLMTEEHTKQFGERMSTMMAAELPYYTADFMNSLQKDFDYTPMLSKIEAPVYLLLGDRGQPNAYNHICDLNLPPQALNKLHIEFVADSCHMPMIENPEKLAKILIAICSWPYTNGTETA